MKLVKLEAEALRLPAKDRARLAKHLLLSLDEAADPDVEKLWIREAERRYKEYKKGNVRGIPAAEAFRRARPNCGEAGNHPARGPTGNGRGGGVLRSRVPGLGEIFLQQVELASHDIAERPAPIQFFTGQSGANR